MKEEIYEFITKNAGKYLCHIQLTEKFKEHSLSQIHKFCAELADQNLIYRQKISGIWFVWVL
jgi:hypothetical protein